MGLGEPFHVCTIKAEKGADPGNAGSTGAKLFPFLFNSFSRISHYINRVLRQYPLYNNLRWEPPRANHKLLIFQILPSFIALWLE